MFRFLPLLWANIWRRPLRSVFTLLSIVVAFLLFGLLEALRFGFFGGVEAAGADRLMTTNRMSIVRDLPGSYLGKVRGVAGVKQVLPEVWFGGWFRDERNQLQVIALDPEVLFEVYPEIHVSDAEKRAWIADRAGVLVGKSLAEQFVWRVGDQIPLQQSIPYKSDGNTWEVTVRGIYTQDGADNRGLFMQYKYLDETRGFGRGRIGWMVPLLENPADAPRISKEIDALFANSSAETKTASEKTWAGDFAKQVGNVGLMLSAVAFAVFFTMLLVTANTMAQSVRERTNEIGVLKTLGFTHGAVTRLVLLESLFLTVVGGAIGLALARLLTQGMKPFLSSIVPLFQLPGYAMAVGLGLMVLLGLVAGALPAARAMRLSVVEALRG
jgi:putative ABC transport system permease protein